MAQVVFVAIVLLLALAWIFLLLALAPGFPVLARLLARVLLLILPSYLALARVVGLDPAPLLALALYLALLFARLTLGLLSALALAVDLSLAFFLALSLPLVMTLAPPASGLASVALVHVLDGPRVWCLALPFPELAPRLGCQPGVVAVLLGV